MFPFWELAVAPVLDASECKRVVEIGALRGENTVQMLDRLGPDTELHVIDPVPDFDPGEHERRFPGRYVFHGDLSLNVLPDLPPMDAALLDGDHNWYTVYHELRALTKVARDNGAPLPVMILHDVLWPYGRRDLYYGPNTIPEEYRHPHAQRGMSPNKKKLLNAGGMNAQLDNAVEEGGPRNGVMTGLEDWMAEHDRPLRRVVLPIYFGLAIVVEEERLARQPALAAVLDHLESAEGRLGLLELSEDIRLNAAVFQQSVFAMRERQVDQGAQRYLNLLKGALLDEHYLENELRIQQLLRHLEEGSRPSSIQMADPLRLLRRDAEVLAALRQAGRLRDESDNLVSYFPWTAMGRVRIDHLQTALDQVRTQNVPGDLVECGTGRGGGAIFLRGYLEAHFMANRQVWVADAFRGSPRSDSGVPANDDRELPVPGGGTGFPLLLADLNMVRDGFARFDLLDDRVRFVQGDLVDTLPDAPIEQIALLRIGDGLGDSVGDVLDELYDKLAIGGLVVVDDYADDACRQAVDEFRARRGVHEDLERVDWAAAWWRKQAEPVAPEGSDAHRAGRPTGEQLERSSRAVGAPLLAPAAVGGIDLSMVVVFYNMRREADRTLHSLSRAYQEGIEGLDYEVIVVDNGSDPDQRLTEEHVRSFGPQFRFIDMGDDAPSSPVFALNRGLAASSGAVVGIMIDGAHVLTPGVLQWGMAGIDLYEPAVVTTQQWYLGPGQQPDMIADGYDQDTEDELLERIYWPTNGYRLFEIGHFIGGRDWFDGVWESNCLFVPRKLLEQVGTFDESFVVGGGGFANLELYERLGSTPGVTEVSILGEGSFHQLHGGTTTNVEDAQERRDRISAYFRQFADMRGRGFRGPNKKIHYVGTMFTEACRTRSRRTTASQFFKKWDPDDPDGRPKTPEPIPEDLKAAFTEAYWRNQGWRKTSWMGVRLNKSPGDLLMYQELVNEIRPDWIIVERTDNGGQAQYMATLCELVGHGQVLAIDDREQTDLPIHERLTYRTMPTHGDETKAEVDAILGPDARALVLLGGGGSANRLIREFDTVHHHVPVGSYVVVENTIVGGHPVWPSFGPGPSEAVKDIISNHHDWVSDPLRERFGLSFNPDGYLKRVR
jgi:cephalosporin hydroxylase